MFTAQLLLATASLVPFDQDSFRSILLPLTADLTDSQGKIDMLTEEVSLTVFADMSLDQLLEGAILVAAQNIQNDIQYDKIATRLLLLQIYLKAFRYGVESNDFKTIYAQSFINYLDKGVTLGLLNADMRSLFDLEKLSNSLVPENDDIYKFIGLSTAWKRYMIHDREQVVLETPQFMWMRIAMGLALKEQNPTEQALRFYHKLSQLDYVPGGSTNIGAGTTYSVLSNCYLVDTEDDIHSIYDNIKNIALIAKSTGALGIAVTKLRAAGSQVKSNNTLSSGPIPFIKVMDAALRSMSRAGKKYGAMTIYMEPWHLNILDFIDLKQSAGDDYQRIRTADTAVYIPDEFMKRVISGSEWYLFDPAETPELTELYGQAFSQRYMEYVELAKAGKMRMFNTISARELMKRILTSLQSTSHPWLTWKDTINLRALNNNTGTIHCSNLCTEITLPQDRDNIAVCNLAYVNLATHVKKLSSGETAGAKAEIDWAKLDDTVRVVMRHLDNLVEVNTSPLRETKNSDDNNRAVGMGMSGFAESLEFFGYAYDSPEAYDLMDQVTEFISYISIDESANMAQERGAYPNYPGSLWSQGYVPFDTMEKVNQDRQGNTGGKQDLDRANLSGIQKQISELKQALQGAGEGEANTLASFAEQLEKYAASLASTVNPTGDSAESKEAAFPNAVGQGIQLRQNRQTRLDWDKLRTRVSQGMRNATTMAIAPNASTGLVLGTSNGIDPRFANIFSRNTYSGKFLDINHNLVVDLQELGVWDQVKDQVISNYGDISEIAEIPEHLKAVYKTSFQISPYAYIEVASRAQKWIDQAMSRNMYLETRDIDEMVDIYTEAWRRGLKTTYYLHTKPRHSAEQSSVRVNKSEAIANTQPVIEQPIEVTRQLMPEVQQMEQVAEQPIEGSIPLLQPEAEPVLAASAPAAPAPVRPAMNSGKSFGFGRSWQSATKVDQKAYHHAPQHSAQVSAVTAVKKVLPPGAACPIDPAERALCEACQ
jgi:ribonucleoside-diphosphate reductase alpha chain